MLDSLVKLIAKKANNVFSLTVIVNTCMVQMNLNLNLYHLVRCGECKTSVNFFLFCFAIFGFADIGQVKGSVARQNPSWKKKFFLIFLVKIKETGFQSSRCHILR